MATSVLGKRSAPSSQFSVVIPTTKPRRMTRSTRRTRDVLSPPLEEEVQQHGVATSNNQNEIKIFDTTMADDACPRTPKKQRTGRSPMMSKNRMSLSPSHVNTVYQNAIDATLMPASPEKPMPRTPRHRDSVKKIPITPRHRVTLIGKPLTPKSQPGTPTSSVPSVFTAAKATFTRSSNPGRLVGREDEKKQLTSYISTRIQSKRGGCLYISGPPGTGKSAMLNEVVQDVTAGASHVKRAYVNCMTMKDPKSVYMKLAEDISSENEMTSSLWMENLESKFVNKTSSHVYVVILDEIDHLLTKDQEILYSIFEWSLAKTSKLILIGIANALDLTDRFLPRLKARNLKPQLVPFLPYSAEQIESVIKGKLRSLLPEYHDAPADFVPYIHPAAITLCSRKVAVQTGDLRKAFDICRRALELFDNELKRKARADLEKQQEQEQKHSSVGLPIPNTMDITPQKKPLAENNNLSSPAIFASSSPSRTAKPFLLPTYTPLTTPRVTIAHIARVSSAAFGGSAITRVKTLNLQQKAVLASCSVLEKRSGVAPTIRSLYSFYSTLCRKDRLLAPLSSTEFRDVVASLEAAGVVDMKNGVGLSGPGTPSKRGRNGGGMGGIDERRISACVQEMDLLTAVADVGPILTRIFSG